MSEPYIRVRDLAKRYRSGETDLVVFSNLNLDVDFLKDKLPSCETLAVEIWKILAPKIKEISQFGALQCVRLYETPRNYVDYYGE